MGRARSALHPGNLNKPSVCMYTQLCVCVHVFVRASGKLSSGNAGLTVPGEDVILSSGAHRDRRSHRRHVQSLPHWFKCPEYDDEVPQLATAFPSSNYPLVGLSVGSVWSDTSQETKDWRPRTPARTSIVLFLWHNSFILASDPVLSKGLLEGHMDLLTQLC